MRLAFHWECGLAGCHIEGGARRPPMEKSPEIMDIYSILKEILDNLDIRLQQEHRWSSANISYSENPYKIDGLGSIGIKPQDSREYILQHSLLERMTLLAMTLLKLSKDSL